MSPQIEQLRTYHQQSKRVLDALASNQGNSAAILNQLQNGERLESIATRLEGSSAASTARNSPYNNPPRTTGTIPSTTNRFDGNRSPSIIESQHEDPSIQSHIEAARHFGQRVILGDETISEDPLSHHGPTLTDESWTTVTSDGELVEHLLALYFCWEYPIFATVSKEHFMEDFRKGSLRYCSPMLVNALLALACRFSDRPGTRVSPGDSTTAGNAFFAEASRLFNAEQDHYSLTTIQALGVMSIREASCGRISTSSFLSAQSIRLAVEMGLHIDVAAHDGDDEADKTERAVREATFWGALSLNEMLSLCTGTLPHLSQRIALPKKPSIIKHVEDALWIPYTDDGLPMDQHFDQPSNIRSVYKIFCELAEIVHDTLYTLYSPGHEVSSGALLGLYNRYIHWYDTIPEDLRLGHNFTPAVLFAHLFYHTATLLLFQPFINLRFNKSAVIPREVCYQAADAITRIVKSYSAMYTLRRTPSFAPYFVLVSTIIHLVAVKNNHLTDEMTKNVLQGIADLEEMAKCHGFALRAIEAIKHLSRRWRVNLSPQNTGDEVLSDMSRDLSHLTLGLPDQFSLDLSVLETLQSIQPVLSSQDPPLFSPFPMQGLPHIAPQTELEEKGFQVLSPK
ncbi:hypothetical protein BP5796_12890 [Coleophoma crateriformis]|uniref:Xylanolytic transcriptional activator regulatory domain-containing protein n=1 Tax=Coleophoma crateriformis TaxID=565419 RepID=A0A3D8Q4T5_9HELO|nr:hypothetical protein BP5796_12890 [Coleophoma crateriformis]